jgi:FkbM family methyltransferase
VPGIADRAKQPLWRALMKTKTVTGALAEKLYPPPPPPPPSDGDARVRPWVAARGDRSLRVEYDLDVGSIVWDVGGYEGDWASDVFSRYRCRIAIFEPIPEFATRIRARFAQNTEITVLGFGLGGRTRRETIAIEQDASSIFKPGERLEEIEIVDVADQLRQSGAGGIDVMKINIEGGEYELLERLVESGTIAQVRHLQVQFHDFVPNAESRMNALHSALSRTHRATFSFPWVWEGWSRKDD